MHISPIHTIRDIGLIEKDVIPSSANVSIFFNVYLELPVVLYFI